MVWSLEGNAPRTRVTDDVTFFCKRGELPAAVNIVQRRAPDFHRWRRAFGAVARVSYAWLQGKNLVWTESALREVIDYLPDPQLAKELVLDARQYRVRMNFGDPLPHWSGRDLMRFADEHDIDMSIVKRIAPLPPRVTDPLDTAAVVLATREMSRRHRRRAQALWLELPDEEEEGWEPRHHAIANVAERSASTGAQWNGLSLKLVG
jgi:hypothetical protein